MTVVKADSLVQVDNFSEQEYAQNGFVPQTEVSAFSYTSGRVAKPVYNKYVKNDFQVFGYYTDWSQYDGRLVGDFTPSQCGRGVDLMTLDVEAYDKIILGFLAIVGDTGEKQATIEQAAIDFERKLDEPTFCDSWGDVLSYLNCGFNSWDGNEVMPKFNQQNAQGVLGGLRKLKEKNAALRLSMSIGGWTMSQAYPFVAADATRRATFCAGVIDLYTRFPMFNEIDLDWEYPGAPGNTGNTYSDADTANYVLLVGDLRKAFDKAGRSDVRISIAASANVDALRKTDIPAMLDAGLYGINLMTYDFFGTPWAEELAHHTNIYPNGINASNWSVDTAVRYLRDIGTPMQQVFIGYASYSRSARGAEISSHSPLTGTYDPGEGTTTGTFESGCTEWYDTIANYLDLENQRGRNGFNLYTDELAEADYLYNDESKLFVSIDTPRTVKAKGEYVAQNGLGGMFTWTIDQCGSLLVNAAREGLGCDIERQTVDMEPFYFKGINVTPIDPTDPTDPAEPAEPIGPTEPAEPAVPIETTEPAEPAVPAVPIGPTEPAEPVEPIETTAPTDPTDPGAHPFPLWSATTIYNGGETVCWKERVYFAQWWTMGEEPGTPAGTGDGKPWRDDGLHRKG